MLGYKRNTILQLFIVVVAWYLPMLNSLLMLGYVHAEDSSKTPHRLTLCLDANYCPPTEPIIYSPSSSTPVAGYFVDNINGNDANNGTSHKQAWKSVARVNSSVSEIGSDVWFRAGQEWSARLVIDWGGTSRNRAIVGTYHLEEDLEMRGLPNDSDPGSPDTAQSSWEGATFFDNYPSGFRGYKTKYRALVKIDSPYVTIENINTWKSNGIGFEVGKKSGGYAILDNVMSHISATQSYLANRDAGHNEVKNSEFSRGANCWGDQMETCNTSGQWSACAQHVGSSNNSFHHNIVRECWGEGSGNSQELNNNHIYNNTFIWVRSVALYANGVSNVLFENNIVLGAAGQSSASSYFRSKSNTGAGAVLSYENTSYQSGISATGNIWRNNLFVGVSDCFQIAGESMAKDDVKAKVGGEFIGNTCINPSGGYFINYLGKKYLTNTLARVDIKNNIFATRSPRAVGNNCKDNGAIALGGIVVGYNLNADDYALDDCDGIKGLDMGDPGFVNRTWSTPGPNNRYDFSLACLTSTSDAIGGGPDILANLTTDSDNNVRTGPFDIGAVSKECLN